jgi:hypothetical protein
VSSLFLKKTKLKKEKQNWNVKYRRRRQRQASFKFGALALNLNSLNVFEAEPSTVESLYCATITTAPKIDKPLLLLLNFFLLFDFLMEQLPPVFFSFGGDFFRFFLFYFSYGKVRKKERKKIIKKRDFYV